MVNFTKDALLELVKKHNFEIGEYSYGKPNIRMWRNHSFLRIGKYCSIAGGVDIFLGGDHNVKWVTTYPFSALFDEAKHISGHPTSRGDVNIGNDVWLGRNCTVLSGVTIGDGACIAAETVVVKDVPPYSIVGGNPSRVLKSRFTEDQILDLLEIRWWDWPHSEIMKHCDILLSDQIDHFIKRAKAINGALVSDSRD